MKSAQQGVMNLVKYGLLVLIMMSNGSVLADDDRSEIAAVVKYLEQDTGSKYFYGISAKRKMDAGFYIGVEMMFPLASENNYRQSGITIKEHGGLLLSYQSSIAEDLYYKLSLLGGIVMADTVDVGSDYSGICNCKETFLEPTIGVLYKVTPNFSIGGMGGVFMISSDSERRQISGIEVALTY